MFLRTLTLKGFKSFADTTTLELEPGVSVIVGPNGSGKSNVVDAVAWVLGAQAPSSVRSQKMDDVIFAGTAKRAALGRAEVSLTLDNTARLLPIDFTEVTITRTLFRTGDSDYAINGVSCRLQDVVELLSDAGVGRQQHVIVSQGQIDEVLNAKPEDRRSIIEEAAGILKYRRRKEKAERRLERTEVELTRLADLLREVRRQLRPLERQADAARRHGALTAELGALAVYLAGREVAGLQARLGALAHQRRAVSGDEAAVKAELARLDTDVMATEARLSALGGSDVGDDLARFEGLRERARGLAAVLAERRRSTEREHGRLMDAGLVATLEADAARLTGELGAVEAEAAGLVPQAEELTESELALARDRLEMEEAWAGGLPAPDGRAAEVRGELAALRASVQRTTAESARVQARLASLAERTARLAADADRLRAECAACEAAELPLVAEQDAAADALGLAEAALASAEDEARAAEDERHGLRARVEALRLALDEARARAGAERLAAVDGVLGTLHDLVVVDEGWQGAFEAAAGEALLAVVAADPSAARRALGALASAGAAGAVVALGAASSGSLTDMGPAGERVRAHVRGRDGDVERLLDRLVGPAVCVAGGWERAMEVATLWPGLVVVTPDGDRFGPSGWRLGAAGGSGATRAALDEAEAALGAAEARTGAAGAARAGARAGLDAARRALADVDRRLDANDGLMTAAADGLARVLSEQRDGATEAEALSAHVDELRERVEREQLRVSELEGELPALEAAEAEAGERARRLQQARARLEERATAVGALRTDLEVRAAGLQERRALLQRRIGEIEVRLARDAAERAAAADRRVRLERTLVALDRLAAVVAAHSGEVEAHLAELHALRRRQSEEARAVAGDLDGLRRRRAAAERRLEELRDTERRLDLEDAEARMRLEAAVEALRRDHDCEPDAAVAAPVPEVPEGSTPAARARELERELKAMGPINPLALEEHTALSERHAFLEGQLEDVRSARRELSKVIRAVDDEIVKVFVAAYADVAANFEQLFTTLFPGGEGRLHLTQPSDPLSTGIEIEAKPSGKNVKKLSLLSGGERSLVALAFLFAVFRSRPSPFYVMDEVEAALDDVNLHRFLELVKEFRSDAQLIIVSHQKRTMEAADCLYGVTMQPGGSSKVVSEKVGEA